MIKSHLRPDQLADAYISMVETYTDIIPETSEDQSIRDKLAAEMAQTLEIMIDNVGMKRAINELIPNAGERYFTPRE